MECPDCGCMNLISLCTCQCHANAPTSSYTKKFYPTRSPEDVLIHPPAVPQTAPTPNPLAERIRGLGGLLRLMRSGEAHLYALEADSIADALEEQAEEMRTHCPVSQGFGVRMHRVADRLAARRKEGT